MILRWFLATSCYLDFGTIYQIRFDMFKVHVTSVSCGSTPCPCAGLLRQPTMKLWNTLRTNATLSSSTSIANLVLFSNLTHLIKDQIRFRIHQFTSHRLLEKMPPKKKKSEAKKHASKHMKFSEGVGAAPRYLEILGLREPLACL